MFGKEKDTGISEQNIRQQAAELLSSMTLKEKVWMLNGNWDLARNQMKYKNAYNPVPIKTNGVKRLDIPPVAFTDGPRGVVMGNSTCFPVSMARGASFDPDLERRVGDVIGKEARAQGANFFGGVCINLLRHPAWGRAQETYGEDPFLLGEMGKALVEGVQNHNVMACVKHYAVNNIENSRFSVNVKSDERTLREVYLPHFRKCIQAGAASVMGAYNKYEGDHCCENHFLLEEVLREDWGFQGFTISDFIYGIRNTIKAIEAGMDIEMPMPVKYQKNLLRAVKNREISEKLIDRSVRRILETQLAFGQATDPNIYNEEMVASQEHTALAEEVALKSMVLIKNEDNLLPLKSEAINKVLLIGRLAEEKNTGDHGSSQVFPPYVVTPLEGFRNYFGESAEVLHCREDEIAKASKLASQADLVVIFAGYDYRDEGEFVVPQETEGEHPLVTGTKNQGMFLKSLLIRLMLRNLADSYTSDDGEPVGGDRQNLGLSKEQVDMIRAVGGINPNTVVSLISGSMIMTNPWADLVPAIFYSWYAGMEGGNALPKLIFGDETPGGKLPFTVPVDESHLPYFSSTDDEITYNMYHGYTLLDKNGHKPAYPFGFGLSYTTFVLSDIQVRQQQNQVQIFLTVKNTGSRDGSEVVQVYAGMTDSEVDRPVKLLKGFQKVSLAAGSSDKIELRINLDELRYFSNEERRWIFESGLYQLYIGTSAAEADLVKFELHLEM